MSAPAIDPALAHKHFAAKCFNAAWDLIDKADRTPDEDDQMLHVAHASVWHWTQREDCTPVKLSIGYWQLSRVYALARRPEEARRCAEKCLKVTPPDQPFYVGYAYEALARAEKLAGNADAAARHLEAGRREASAVKEESDRQALTADLDSLA